MDVIDTSSFTDTTYYVGRRRENTVRSNGRSYVHITGPKANVIRKACAIYLSRPATEKFRSLNGTTCRVLWDADSETFYLVKGWGVRLADTGAKAYVAIGTLLDELVDRYGYFTHLYLDESWDTDEHGRPVLALKVNGEKVMA